MDAPTCRQLFDEELGDAVFTDDDTSWRHGFYRTEVYHRAGDDTYWQVGPYCVQTDGEYNGLRDGDNPKIVQVKPTMKTVTAYEPI